MILRCIFCYCANLLRNESASPWLVAFWWIVCQIFPTSIVKNPGQKDKGRRFHPFLGTWKLWTTIFGTGMSFILAMSVQWQSKYYVVVFFWVPSLKLTVCPWKSPSFLVNTIKMVDVPASYVSDLEGWQFEKNESSVYTQDVPFRERLRQKNTWQVSRLAS